MAVSDRWILKYMRLAKQFGEDDNRCYSRQIGVVLVNPQQNRILSTGLNGPPRGVPPCDSRYYLEEVFWSQLRSGEKLNLLTAEEVAAARKHYEHLSGNQEEYARLTDGKMREAFGKRYAGCGRCPRKLLGVPSGERLELCSCSHAERNAIYNACCDLHGAWAFCWCILPCHECTIALIQAGIQRVFCLKNDGKDYSPTSRWLFRSAGILVEERTPEYYLAEPCSKSFS